MPAERYYTETFFVEGDSITLKDQEAHHLIHVMRNHKEDIVELVNGKNQLAQAEVIHVERKEAILKIIACSTSPEKTSHIVIAQGIPRLNRLETIIEKCTELDADEIWLFPGDLSEKKELSENQKHRVEAIAISSMKQCGRLQLPKIIYKKALKHWKAEDIGLYQTFFGDTEPSAKPFKNAFFDLSDKILFFIGPEAGFSAQEENMLKSLDAKGVKLHSNILRTDTASIVALSVIHHWNQK